MRQTEMTEQEVGTLVYWEISQAARSRPKAVNVTVGDALKIIGERLTNLNPERRVSHSLRKLMRDIIEKDDTDVDYGNVDAV